MPTHPKNAILAKPAKRTNSGEYREDSGLMTIQIPKATNATDPGSTHFVFDAS